MVDARCLFQAAGADGIANDVVDLRLGISQVFKRRRDRLIDDPEIPAAGQLLELDQGKVGLDAGGVAIHDQADSAGRRDHRNLGVAVAMGFAQFQSPVPGPAGGGGQFLVGAGAGFQWHRRDGQVFVAVLIAVGGTAMIADHPQHGFLVFIIPRKGAHLAGHFRRRGVGDAGHDGGNGGADGAALFRIIGDAGGHQIAADIGETQAQGAKIVALLRHLAGRELGHEHGKLKRQGP